MDDFNYGEKRGEVHMKRLTRQMHKNKPVQVLTYTLTNIYVSVLILMLGAFLATADVKADTIETPWQKYETSHFVLYTDIEPAQALLMMDELEVFKASLEQLLRVDSGVPLPKLTAYRFNTKSLYSLFVQKPSIGGYYTNTANGPIIVIGDSNTTGIGGLNIVFHEYIHFFQRAVSGPSHPTWFSEGLAEFFSSLKIEQDVIKIGQAPAGRLKHLQANKMLELDTLFSLKTYIESDILNSRLYSSAWLVTHFMMLSHRNGFSDYNANLAKMLALQANGVDAVEAFNQSFDIDLVEFKAQIREYARIRNLNGAQFPRPKVAPNVTVTPLTIAQSYAVLAPIAFGRTNSTLFEDFLAQGVALNDTLSLAMLGAHKVFKDDNEAGLAMLDAALENTSNTELTAHPLAAQVEHFKGESYFNLARQLQKQRKQGSLERKDVEQADKYVDQALMHYQSSYELEPSPYTLRRLMHIYSIKKDLPRANQYANELYQAIPLSIEINYEVGMFMANNNNIAFAKFLLANVVKWAPESKMGLEAALRLHTLAD
jgi:hypothetical protein